MSNQKVVSQSLSPFAEIAKKLFSKTELALIHSFYFNDAKNPAPMNWTLLHVLAYHSDAWVRPNPLFSSFLAEQFIKDGIKDNVEERAHDLSQLADYCLLTPNAAIITDSQGRSPLYFTAHESLIEKLLYMVRNMKMEIQL